MTSTTTESKEQIKCFACKDKNAIFEQWAYTPRPLGENDIEVDIQFAGVCYSDVHTATSGWGEAHYPACVGHEIVGKVCAKGKSVTKFNIGDRVGIGCQVDSCKDGDCHPCSKGHIQLCDKRTYTYNAKYPGEDFVTKGGYADKIRCNDRFVFKIPDSLPGDVAAPLLCAGVTVYSPLVDHCKKGDRVLVAGFGGLGHLAVQFAAKMGMEVTVLSSSTNKKDDAEKLGAKHFLVMTDKEEMKKAQRSFDAVIVTASSDPSLDSILSLVDLRGKVIILGGFEKPATFSVFSIFRNEAQIIGSLIGTPKKIEAMLAFAAENKVYPVIEKWNLNQVNDAWKALMANKVRYRAVLIKDETTFK